MSIELIIFDCDGVLVDSEPITTATWVEAVGALGLDWRAEGHHFKGGKMADVIEAAEAQLGEPVPDGFVEAFREKLFARLRSEVRAVGGVHEVLDALVQPACVASNGPRAKMEATLGSTGLLERFEGRIFSAYEVGSFKPEPELFLHAARAMGAAPERCVVVEDSDTGVRAAKAAGMAVFAYDPDGQALRDETAPRLTHMHELLAYLDGAAS